MKNSHHFNSKRRGVGTIVAGAIIAAILFTAVYTYFYVIMQSEVTRGENEVSARQAVTSKQTEQFSAVTYNNSGTVGLVVNNTGAIPIQLAYMSAYKSNSMPLSPPSGALSTGLNSGKGSVLSTSLNANSSTYTFAVITSRGNLAYAQWPPAFIANKANVTYIANNASNYAISNALGSVEVSFKSLGYIQNRAAGTHDGTIDQRGWSVNFTSLGARGYPAFYLAGNPTILTVKARNVDPSGADFVPSKHSVVILSLGGQNNNQSPPVYLCYVNEQTHQISAYDENTANKVTIPNSYAKMSNSSYGWVNLYFCGSSPGGTGSWTPSTNNVDISPVFMIIRGIYPQTNQDYGQSIPYQAATLVNSLNLCLKVHNNANTCSTSTGDQYTGSANTANQQVDLQGLSGPYDTTISWIDNTGKNTILLSHTNAAVPAIPIPYASKGTYIIQVEDAAEDVTHLTFQLN